MATGNGDRPDIPEPYTWKCPVKGASCAQGRAATKQDAKDAETLHVALLHPDDYRSK